VIKNRILIVDDSETQSKFLEAVVSNHVPHADIVRVLGMKQALSLIETQPPFSVAVVDICLADDLSNRDGLSVIDALREQSPTTFRILVTGRLEEWHVQDDTSVDMFVRIHRNNRDRRSQLERALDEALCVS
jgi:CheY-like chemotaxis protein